MKNNLLAAALTLSIVFFTAQAINLDVVHIGDMKSAILGAVSVKSTPTKNLTTSTVLPGVCHLKLSIFEEKEKNGSLSFKIKNIEPIWATPSTVRKVKELTYSDPGDYILRTYNMYGQTLRSYALRSSLRAYDVDFEAPSGMIETYIDWHDGVHAVRVIHDGKVSNPIIETELVNCLVK